MIGQEITKQISTQINLVRNCSVDEKPVEIENLGDILLKIHSESCKIISTVWLKLFKQECICSK